MIIYKVEHDVENYQSFLPTEREVGEGLALVFDCTRRGENWRPPSVCVHQPLLKRGNFYSFVRGDPLVCDGRAMSEVGELLRLCAETLPLLHNSETFHVINVLTCVDALDHDRVEWFGTRRGKGALIKRLAFNAGRVPPTPLFKIPETQRTAVYAAAHTHDAALEFKQAVDRSGLTGLTFKEVWSDEG